MMAYHPSIQRLSKLRELFEYFHSNRSETFLMVVAAVANDFRKRLESMVNPLTCKSPPLFDSKSFGLFHVIGITWRRLGNRLARSVAADYHVWCKIIQLFSAMSIPSISYIVLMVADNIRKELEKFDCIGLRAFDVWFMRVISKYLGNPKKYSSKSFNVDNSFYFDNVEILKPI